MCGDDGAVASISPIILSHPPYPPPCPLPPVLTHEEDVDGALDAILDAIKGLIERGELKSSLVDRSTIETVVRQLTKDENDLNQVGREGGEEGKEAKRERKHNWRCSKANLGYQRLFSNFPSLPPSLPSSRLRSTNRKQLLSGTPSACPR